MPAAWPDSRKLLKICVFFFPLIVLSVFIVIKTAAPAVYAALNEENGLVKNAQSGIFLISSVLAFLMAVDFFKKGIRLYAVLYAAFAAGLFFVSMEEIGWALRMLHVSVPDYFKAHNIQHEVSLHNLPSVRWYVNEAYILLGFFCSFLWIIVPKKITTMNPGVATYFIPGRELILYFLPVFFLYTYFAYVSGILVRLTGLNIFHIGFMNGVYAIDFVDQEPAELLMALGILGFVIRGKMRQARQASFDVPKSARFALSLLMFLLAVAVPFHFAHAFAQNRLYPYDRLELGRLFHSQGRFHDAVAQYEMALRIDPIHAETYSNLGISLLELKRYKEADACLLRAMELSPRDASSEYNLAISLYRQGKVDEGAVHYTKAVQANPALERIIRFEIKDKVMLDRLGSALLQQGKAEESLWFFAKALQLKPDYLAQYNLGSAFLAAGKIDKAIIYLKKSLELKTDNALAYNNLANALAQKGKTEEALAHYREALRINPGLVDAYINRGITLKREGRNQEAMEQFSEALRLDPHSEKAMENLQLLQEKYK